MDDFFIGRDWNRKNRIKHMMEGLPLPIVSWMTVCKQKKMGVSKNRGTPKWMV